MTREQARREIDDIDYYLQHHTDDYSESSHTAMMMAIQALSQEPCNDAVSREAVNNLYDMYRPSLATHVSEFGEVLKALPSVNPQPCDDAISREAAINIASLHCLTIDETVKALERLPSVTQKSGKWIAVYQGDEIINYRCSECELGDTNGSTNLYGWDYCRRCGAKMVEPQESEE